MYILILYSMLFSTFITLFLGRYLGNIGSKIVSILCINFNLMISLICNYEICYKGSNVVINLGNWISLDELKIDWICHYDNLSINMIVMILMVSSMVIWFSFEYMYHDPHNQRFYGYINGFVFFMLILISADNLLILFIGWEFIGIFSYLLINYWFTWSEANKAGLKAILVNRIGDTFLTLGFCVIYSVFGDFSYSVLFSLSSIMNKDVIYVISFLLMLGGMAKSAQVGYNIWLPFSMTGPTPVSALIHAATLVTAGVYLIIRCSWIFEYADITLIWIIWIGSISTIIMSSTGLFQNDLKKIIAYSTCSQMSYLFIACGLSNYNLALFHLINHAIFKGLLFIGAGCIIHASFDEQDQRKYGGYVGFLPLIYISFIIGNLALMAIPFISGYYSKDVIIEMSYSQYEINGYYAYWLSVISAILTPMYSLKMIFNTFYVKSHGSKWIYENIHEIKFMTIISIVILSICSLFFGYLGKEYFVGQGSQILFEDNSIFIHPDHYQSIDYELIPYFYKNFSFFGFMVVFVMMFSKTRFFRFNSIFRIMSKNYHIDQLFNARIYNYLDISYKLFKYVDNGLIELIGPKGIERVVRGNSIQIRDQDNKDMHSYLMYFVFSMLIILLLIYLGIDMKMVVLLIMIR